MQSTYKYIQSAVLHVSTVDCHLQGSACSILNLLQNSPHNVHEDQPHRDKIILWAKIRIDVRLPSKNDTSLSSKVNSKYVQATVPQTATSTGFEYLLGHNVYNIIK
jgi:hypothetical protein